MGIRNIALYLVVAGLSIYAWKDWFKSLCGLILLMAVIDHPDMPRTIFGIQGFNPWNALFLVVFLAWFADRCREGFTWDMPRHINVLLLMFVGLIVLGFLRAAFDCSNLEDYPLSSLISEELINTVKWILPGLLLFDGCRTRNRAIMALASLLIMYFALAFLVVRNMPLETAFEGGWIMKNARSNLDYDVGYHSTDLSVLFGGVFWGLLAALQLIRTRYLRIGVLAAAGVVVFAQALTGGRAGYVALGATGLTLCLLKWRKYLILAPVVVMLLPWVFPGAAARMLQGFSMTDLAGETVIDLDEGVTSGRTRVWPHVIDKIGESPLIGYGRLAMERSGLTEYLRQKYGEGEAVTHPHNMYLETLLDNGILGSIPVLTFFVLVVVYSASLFRSKNRLFSAIGGLSLALMLSSLIGGITGQHWYPLEHTFGIWAATFLMLRIRVEEKWARMGAVNAENHVTIQHLSQRQADIVSFYAWE